MATGTPAGPVDASAGATAGRTAPVGAPGAGRATGSPGSDADGQKMTPASSKTTDAETPNVIVRPELVFSHTASRDGSRGVAGTSNSSHRGQRVRSALMRAPQDAQTT